MRKFFPAAAVAVIAGGFGWMASTTARVAQPASSAGMDPMQIMTGSANLPTEHFVDYSLVYP